MRVVKTIESWGRGTRTSWVLGQASLLRSTVSYLLFWGESQQQAIRQWDGVSRKLISVAQNTQYLKDVRLST